MTEEQPQRKFEIRKIYLKDVSFESPHSPDIFVNQSLAPQIDVRLKVQPRRMQDDQPFYDTLLIVTVTATLEDKTVFLVEVQQGGVFEISGVSDQELPVILEVACPNLLLPFAREAVADLATKGGFPQLLINPINFETIYRQKLKQQQEKEKADEEGKIH